MAMILQRRFPDLEMRTLADYPGAPEPEETGATYAENAAIKAEAAAALTGEWCVADDAGLEVDFLDGAPGLYSKRFAGEGTNFPEKMAIILREMASVPEHERGARFRCLVALAKSGEATRLVEGVCEGRIGTEPRGSHGFGYDPIFWLPERGCAMAELPPDEKHKISHRGMALAKLGELIERLG